MPGNPVTLDGFAIPVTNDAVGVPETLVPSGPVNVTVPLRCRWRPFAGCL